MFDIGFIFFVVFFKDWCSCFDLVVFGFVGCCCMFGLCCEEVVQCVNISIIWYIWLEQGCGGVLFVDVFNCIVCVLMLMELECEYMYMLVFGCLLEVCYMLVDGIVLCLQCVFDFIESGLVMIKIVIWQIVGWNWVVILVMMDYLKLLFNECNIL